MEKRFGFTVKRLISYLSSLLLPAAGLILPIALLCSGFCFNGSMLVFLILCLVAAGLLALTIFSNRTRKPVKALLSVIVSILFVVLYLFNFMFGTFGYLDCYDQEQVQEPYAAIRQSSECSWMPDLTQVGEPVNISYYSYHAKGFIFLWDAEYLVCSYEPEEYERQKANLDHTYRFQTEPLHVYDGDCEPTAELDGYVFRFVDVEGSFWTKQAPLIGYSDEAHEIMYVNYYDPDRDIYTSLKDLLIEDGGWKYIR